MKNIEGLSFSNGTLTVNEAATSGTYEVEITAKTVSSEIRGMDTKKVTVTVINTAPMPVVSVPTGNIENLSETLARLETLTEVKTLDLLQVTGVSELKLKQTTLEDKQSIKKVEITGNETLTTLNSAGSKVETVDAKGCESLEYLDVSETPITVLNVQDYKNLGTLNCASCDISYFSIEGCEKLETLDCRNNSLPRLDLTAFNNLNKLECRDQHIYG